MRVLPADDESIETLPGTSRVEIMRRTLDEKLGELIEIVEEFGKAWRESNRPPPGTPPDAPPMAA